MFRPTSIVTACLESSVAAGRRERINERILFAMASRLLIIEGAMAMQVGLVDNEFVMAAVLMAAV
jgi:hypothetical protein